MDNKSEFAIIKGSIPKFRRARNMKIDHSVYKTIGLISQLGISMLTPILMCVFSGRFLDEKFGWSTVIPLLILGILSGGRNAYLLIMGTLPKKEEEEDE